MRLLLLAALALTPVSTAWATGGIGCEADDARAVVLVEALTTRGMGHPILSFDGRVEVKDQTIAPDLRTTTFEARHLAQYWAEDDEVRLFLYREREAAPHGYVQLIMRTRFDAAGDLNGRYELEIFDGAGDGRTVTINGDIACVLG